MSFDFPKNWKQVVLEDALDALIDYRGKTPKKVDKGIPLITAKVVKSGRILPMDEFIADEDYESWMVRGIPQISDIVVTTEAPLGEVAQIKNANVALAQRIVTLRGKVDFLENDFLLFLMQSDFVQNQLEARATGSTVKGIKQSELRKIILPIPPIVEQKCIGKILSDLDDKIHLNNQINQTLESIAQVIFKSWFIDFDPVRAKITAKQEGKDTELAAMCAISSKSEVEIQQMSDDDFTELQATAALFPDELVESELGEVPKGWEISKISKIGKVITGKTPSSKIENSFAEKGTFFITPTDIDTEVFVTNTNRYLSEYGEIAIKNSKVDEGSLCITCIGSQMGKVVITPKSAFTNQQINSILLFNSTLRNYIFLNLRQRRDEIFLIGSGGSTMPIINKSTFESLNLILPDLALIRKFDNFISPFFNNILSNSVENIELKNIRDALLPELLAGKINVSMLKDM